MNILLLGATGQVGHELLSVLPKRGRVTTTARDDSADRVLDAGDLAALRALLDAVRPDIVVNAVAYTAVDQAESEPDAAWRLNAELPGALGEWAAANGALVVHYSTDYVFDGSKPAPYVETDPTNPLNVYGRSKLGGDERLLGAGCAALILRVSWVYGNRGKNFLLTMQRLMKERESLNVVDDQLGAPTWCRTIAEVTGEMLRQWIEAPERRAALSGVYHLAPAGETSWHGFARAIARRTGSACIVNAIPTTQYPTPAKRPLNSRMDAKKLRETFGLELPDWEADLKRCLGG